MREDELARALVQVMRDRGYSVTFVPGPFGDDGQVNGRTEYDSMTVTVALQPLDGATPVTVLAHELAHIVLDHRNRKLFGLWAYLEPLGALIPAGMIGTPQAEIEAEDTSAGVLAHYGLADDAVSQYDAVWSHNAKLAGQTISREDIANHVSDGVATIVQAIDSRI